MFAVGWGANQFSAMLLAYRLHRGVSTGSADALFGVYALGLIPALLVLGPVSDARGRRTIVCVSALLSGLASVALIVGDHSLALLYVGRLLAGLCSGAAFAAGTAWVKELSVAPFDPRAGPQAGARRAAIALSAGFGLGPLVAGLLAQWSPDPLLVAYLPHLLVVAVALALVPRVPETVPASRWRGRTGQPAAARRGTVTIPRRFLGVVAPSAPWVFVAPSVAFAALPALVSHQVGSFQVGFAALMAALTLGVGVGVQPLARRLDAAGPGRGLQTGLATTLAGLVLGALAVHLGSWPLVVPAAILLGAGYGFCLVSGLLEVQSLAAPEDLAALTAIFYALTYVGFATPLVIAELQALLRAPVILLAGALLAALTLAGVRRGLHGG